MVPAVIVTVPVRAAPVFAPTETIIVDPLTPDDGENVTHGVYVETHHEDWFVVTVTFVEDAEEVGDQLVCDSDRVATPAAW